MIDRTISQLFPASGGVIGAIAKSASIFTTMVFKPWYYLDVVICAALGAAVGYFVKWGLDYLFKRKRNGKEITKNSGRQL